MTSAVIQVKNRFVNLYLLDAPEGLTLIDTGLAQSGPKAILQQLQYMGRQPSDLKRILITHTDPDHSGGAAELKAATGAQLFCSAIEQPALERGGLSREPNGNAIMKAIFNFMNTRIMPTPPVAVDGVLANGDVLPILGGLHVIATPGHTPGHLSFYLPSQQMIIAGDAWNASSGKLRFAPAPVHWNYEAGVASVKTLEALHAKWVYCGHGPRIEIEMA